MNQPLSSSTSSAAFRTIGAADPRHAEQARRANGMAPQETFQLSDYASADQQTTSSLNAVSFSQQPATAPGQESSELRDRFQDFVGQTFFGQLIQSMRTSQKGAAYFNGGRAEEIFQGQMDQLLSEKLSDASAQSISDPMFELFQLGRVQ